jgi:hypothetical protein
MTKENGISNNETSAYSRQEPPGFLERAGVFYYRRLAQRASASDHDNVSIQELPLDNTLRFLAENATTNAAIIAFAIGAATTMVTVWVEQTYSNTMETLPYYSLLGGVTLIMLLIEFAVLFWAALRTVHRLAQHLSQQILTPALFPAALSKSQRWSDTRRRHDGRERTG